MTKTVLAPLLAALLIAPALAQTPRATTPQAPQPAQPGPVGTPRPPQRGVPPEPPPAPPQPPRAAALAADSANVRLELGITDTYGGTPTKKTVSMMILSGQNGMIRTSGSGVFLNIDANVRTYPNDLISVRVTFEYMPAVAPPEGGSPPGRPAQVNEMINVLLREGKPLVVSQSADPVTDRKVTVELTATVVK